MHRTIATLLALLSAAPLGAAQEPKIKAVTTIPDLADFVRQVGGDLVEVTSLARGTEDLHRVPVRPRFLVLLQEADIFFELGFDAEEGWVPPLLEQGRNPKIKPGTLGFVNGSWRIEALEVPKSVAPSQGMLHPRGNPHYNLDPVRGRQLLINVATGLIRAFPQHEEVFKRNFAAYDAKLRAKIEEWKQLAKPLAGKELVTFHRSLSYLANRYGFHVIDQIEPKPGIPPTPTHLALLEEEMNDRKIQVVAVGHYYSHRVPSVIAERQGAKVIRIALMVDGLPEAGSYIDMIDSNLKKLLAAFDLPTELPAKKGDG